jgi:hypothetical protein
MISLVRCARAHYAPITRSNLERTSMSDPKTTPSSDGNAKITIFWLLALYTIATFLWRTFVPGGEWPRSPTRFITMAIDLVCVVSLILLKVQLSAVGKPGKRLSTGGAVMFWIALLAGLGVLAIRLHDDASWATGHLHQ